MRIRRPTYLPFSRRMITTNGDHRSSIKIAVVVLAAALAVSAIITLIATVNQPQGSKSSSSSGAAPDSARTMSVKFRQKAPNKANEGNNILQYAAVDAATEKEITMESWIRLISDPDSSDVARQMMDIMKNAPYEAFRFETPGVSPNAMSLISFEFVLVKDSYLASFASTPDNATFAGFLSSPSCIDGSKDDNPAGCVFANLGGDATLVAPRDWSPESSPSLYSSSYGHLANFVRGAPEEQVLKMWRTLGNVLKEKYLDPELLSSEANKPKWFSTAGAGVAWLHFRIDSRPKYYHYVPYKDFVTKESF